MKATSIDLYFMILFLIVRKFVKQNNTLAMALLDGEKFEFVANSVSWIEGRNIMDSCFTLNFGYDAPLPWPQVIPFTCVHKGSLRRFDHILLTNR